MRKTLTFSLVLNNAQGTVVVVWWPFIDSLFKKSCLYTDRLAQTEPLALPKSGNTGAIWGVIISKDSLVFFFFACFLPETRKAKMFVSVSGIKRLMSPLRRQQRLQKRRCKNVWSMFLCPFFFIPTHRSNWLRMYVPKYMYIKTSI